MIVRELRTILDHLPDDLEVIVDGAHHACHVSVVDRRPRHPMIVEHDGARWKPGERTDGCVVLRGTIGWWWPPTDYRLVGAFRRRAELLAELDPDVPA